MDVIDMQSKQAASIRACDQQFQVEKSVRQLTSDISATQLTIRRKKDELDALQTRLLRLSSTLHDASTDKNFAKNKVRQLEAIRKQHHGLMRCTNCAKEFVPDAFANHVSTCLASNSSKRLTVVSRVAATRALPEMKTSRSVNQIMDQAQDIEYRALSMTTTEAHEQRKLPCFVSQPPRNLRVDGSGGKSVTHNSILLQWDPPIFTGSTPIIDYEVRFSICHFVKRMKDGESCVSRTFESLPPQTTSRWCLQNPVTANQFWVRDLTADQVYGAFTICAITKNGKSQPSNQVELIATAAAIPPSKPYFLCVGVVTAKTITLTWKEPMDDGGKPIDFYEICFNEAVMEDTILERSSINDKNNNFLDVSEVVYKPRRIRTNSNVTTFTLTDLLSGKEHKNFQVRAINQTGIPGDFSDLIASIFTIAPGNGFKLLDELQAAVNSRARVVDSQFLSGFMQRYDRDHYVRLISRFITSLHPDMEGKVNAILSRTRITMSEGESDDEGDGADDDPIGEKLRSNTPKPQFEDLLEEEQIQERRRQFHFRISELKQRLKTADYNVQWCKDRRIDLVALIRAAENRTLEKQAELERAKMFTGPQMDSDVLENGLQRFYTKDLIFALEDEIVIEQLYIVDTKSEIVQVENYLGADERKRDAIQARLQNRKDALEAFETNPYGNTSDSTHQDVKVTSLARLRDGVLFRAFSAFVINRASAIEMRKKVRATLLQFVNYRCRMAFTHWVTVVRKVLRRSSEENKGGACGVGSIALVNAALGRDDLLLQSRELLQQLRQTDENLESLVWTKEQQAERQQLFTAKMDADQAHNQPSQRQDKVSPFLLEADAKMDIEDFEGAARLYDFVYSNDTWMNEMPLAMVLDLLLKLGKVNYHMQNYEQALVFLNRAAFLAVKLGKRGEEGAVTLCMAHVNFALRSLRLSIENYEHALLCFEATGDKKGQLSCFRGLEQVHGKLEDTEMVQANKELADEIEFALATKLSNAGQVLDHLRMRLVGAGAESFTEIMLERVGSIVPRLRTQRIMRKLDIREEAKLVASLESLLLEKKALLAQGEVDLKRALASDTPLVDSSAIIGTNVRYEIEDFKKTLAKLMG
uniref:Fibronectin type-III domain-containing protein n=1 Tax=Globisporangium ultimum (strain ATCC 200006 / CBS 805.95 / DAOM BR144) TaxID=431595 RepID=K3WHI3_GLOUD